jgi:hypothetical protein
LKDESAVDSTKANAPATVRWAAVALVAYGLVVLANATVLQIMNDWEGAAEYPRALIRAFGVSIVAWGLLRRAPWAWWLAVVLGVFWLVSSGFALAMFLRVRTPEADALLPSGFHLTFGVTTALLALAVALLCHPSSRAAFRSRAV